MHLRSRGKSSSGGCVNKNMSFFSRVCEVLNFESRFSVKVIDKQIQTKCSFLMRNSVFQLLIKSFNNLLARAFPRGAKTKSPFLSRRKSFRRFPTNFLWPNVEIRYHNIVKSCFAKGRSKVAHVCRQYRRK